MLVISCVATILFVLLLTSKMVTPKIEEKVVHRPVQPTAIINRSPSFVIELGKDNTPWYMKPLETKTKQ